MYEKEELEKLRNLVKDLQLNVKKLIIIFKVFFLEN